VTRLGLFQGEDTVASLLYDIEAKLTPLAKVPQIEVVSGYITKMPTATNPVDVGKPAKITMTVRVLNDADEPIVVRVFVHDGTKWVTLPFVATAPANSPQTMTIEFVAPTGKFYFAVGSARFQGYMYIAVTKP
jgi:hypothetical protein